MFRVQAAWPRPISDATAALWSERLSSMDPEIAARAVDLLVNTKTMQPTIAELNEAYRASTPTDTTKAIEVPVDVSARARIHAMAEAFQNRTNEVITDSMLDAAGVPHWRARLRDARELDEDRGLHRVNYDLAWASIKAEYLAAKEPVL